MSFRAQFRDPSCGRASPAAALCLVLALSVALAGVAAADTAQLPAAIGASEPPIPQPREPVPKRRELEERSVVRLESPLSPMVRIPASSFLMGSEESETLEALADCAVEPYGHRCSPTLFANEMPRHLVHLSSYWIDRFEVRVRDYERCVQAGACGPRPSSEGTQRFDLPDYPVSRVTWNDAQAYCAFHAARLPTEAEFERAARGLEGRRYPWGDLWNPWAGNHGRFGWDVTDAGDGFAELAPVGSFEAGATPEGVYDLAGNVAEWISDRYVPTYEAAPVLDPQGPSGGSSNLRVVRGGSYGHARFRLRGASRAFAEPSERRATLGFRCARSARRRTPG